MQSESDFIQILMHFSYLLLFNSIDFYQNADRFYEHDIITVVNYFVHN